MRVALIGCGAAKLSRPAPARELYTGCLFRDALGYAEGAGFDDVLVLSALHGLLELERTVEPYDWTFDDLGAAGRARLSAHVCQVLRWRVGAALAELTVLAGEPYAELVRPLARDGWRLLEPLRGLTLGDRRGWFAARRKEQG